MGDDTISGGLEGTCTSSRTRWSNGFFANLFDYDSELTRSPAGAHQCKPKASAEVGSAPDAHDSSMRHGPSMLTTDLTLRFDPEYTKISRRFYEHPDEIAAAFAHAWFKLTHRAVGPRARYLGPEVPAEELIWQDLIASVDHRLVGEPEVTTLEDKILTARISVPQLLYTA